MFDLNTEPHLLLAVFNSMPGAFLLLSREFSIEAISDVYLEATLTERKNLMGRSIFEAFPDNPQTPEAKGVSNLRASLEQVLATGKPHEMARQHYDVPDPENVGQFVERHWLPRNTPVLDAQGQVRHIIHAVVNVTGQVQADRLLRQSQIREVAAWKAVENQRAILQRLFEQAPAAISLFEGPEQRISLANAMMCNLWGRSPGQVLGRSFNEALPELQDQHFSEQIATVFHTQVPFVGTEIPAQIFRQGHLKTGYFNLVFQPLYNEQGQVLGVLNVAVEVTEQVNTRHQVQQLNEKLQVINEELLATNEEVLRTQWALQSLNEELEGRVVQRTQEVQKAQAEAERQRLRLERLFMQAPAAICILGGADLVYELVNPAYQQLFPGRHLLGSPILKVLPEISENKVYRTFQEVFRTGKTHKEQELLIPLARPQDGVWEKRYFNFIQQARNDWQGRIDGVVVFAFEVTEQVKARQASEASTQQLRLITDALPVLIGYLDQDEKYQFANQAYESWFNQKPADLLGHPVREIIGETAYQRVKEYIDRALAGERLNFEASMPYREGFTKHIRTSYVPDWQNGQVVGFYTLINDITNQVAARQSLEASEKQATALAESLLLANQELQQTNQELLRVNVDLDNFIYTASHDLKAPILNIEGLMEALRDQLPPASIHDKSTQYTMHLIVDSVQRFKRTIDHLTEITKLQKENSLEATPIDLATLIAEVQLDLTPDIQAAQAKIELEVGACPSIYFSPKNLRNIMYNLLSNALKYRSPTRTSWIKVHCSQKDEYQVLSVSDNGLGMDLSGKPKLFSMFQRLHNHVEGSGIGLYMFKRIIDNAGGKIQVQSTLDEGSTFQVFFPRNKQ
ncbi:PAS domain-containing protein [Adhaeribacter pallidiroseus]|uniref:histidine kinase n=1 Tax=Adhaeribacter pallidiroseus TaxID=2072847 RepID=A0A369QJG6_9BACT|nr:PAS domain-containing protein [Adhaeribacter pallidiroseus]RDC62418.1 Protein-glutamate O-methyltransferase [Adhaeribacter pallidiroseus]